MFETKKQLICTDCGSIGKTKKQCKGNLAIEIILWICYIVPGLIYTIWRQTTYRQVCKVCGSEDVVPVDSPVGIRMQKEHAGALS